jgi:hypothetical protein
MFLQLHEMKLHDNCLARKIKLQYYLPRKIFVARIFSGFMQMAIGALFRSASFLHATLNCAHNRNPAFKESL